MNRLSGSENDMQDELARAVAILQRCGKDITVGQLVQIVVSIRVRYVVAVITVLAMVATGAYTLGKNRIRDGTTAAPAQRERIAGPLAYRATYAHRDTSELMVAAVKYLDKSGFSVVKIETEPFKADVDGFRLSIEPNVGSSITGYTFRSRHLESGQFFQQLALETDGRYPEVSVPTSQMGDHLLLVIRIAGLSGRDDFKLNRIVTMRAKP